MSCSLDWLFISLYKIIVQINTKTKIGRRERETREEAVNQIKESFVSYKGTIRFSNGHLIKYSDKQSHTGESRAAINEIFCKVKGAYEL